MKKSRNVIMTFGFILAFSLATQGYAENLRYVNSDSRFGCQSKVVYNRLVSIAVSGDDEAFKELFGSSLLIGECVQLKIGTAVYVEDTSFFFGMVKIRPKGSIVGVWTSPETIGN